LPPTSGLNSTFYAKAKSIGFNPARRADALREELATLERFEAQHGSFSEMARAHYERDDGAV
jgi:hypothetical protein